MKRVSRQSLSRRIRNKCVSVETLHTDLPSFTWESHSHGPKGFSPSSVTGLKIVRSDQFDSWVLTHHMFSGMKKARLLTWWCLPLSMSNLTASRLEVLLRSGARTSSGCLRAEPSILNDDGPAQLYEWKGCARGLMAAPSFGQWVEKSGYGRPIDPRYRSHARCSK